MYWISSNTSVRSTTAPGVAAMLRPTSKADRSTISGMRGGDAMSRSELRRRRGRGSCRRCRSAALAEAGFSSGTLLGARPRPGSPTRTASASSSRQSRSASATSSSAVCARREVEPARSRRSNGLLVQAASAKRRSRLDGRDVDVPTAIRPDLGAEATQPPASACAGCRTRPAASLAVDSVRHESAQPGRSAASISSASSGAA